jgi:hypothetical protein
MPGMNIARHFTGEGAGNDDIVVAVDDDGRTLCGTRGPKFAGKDSNTVAVIFGEENIIRRCVCLTVNGPACGADNIDKTLTVNCRCGNRRGRCSFSRCAAGFCFCCLVHGFCQRRGRGIFCRDGCCRRCSCCAGKIINTAKRCCCRTFVSCNAMDEIG